MESADTVEVPFWRFWRLFSYFGDITVSKKFGHAFAYKIADFENEFFSALEQITNV